MYTTNNYGNRSFTKWKRHMCFLFLETATATAKFKNNENRLTVARIRSNLIRAVVISVLLRLYNNRRRVWETRHTMTPQSEPRMPEPRCVATSRLCSPTNPRMSFTIDVQSPTKRCHSNFELPITQLLSRTAPRDAMWIFYTVYKLHYCI